MSKSKSKANPHIMPLPAFWSKNSSKILFSTVTHPIEYAKVLMQIGYEPVIPKPTTTLFGKPALKLPNIFEYINHIKKIDGIPGLYRGLIPKLCGNIVCAITTEKIQHTYEKARELEEELDEIPQIVAPKEKFLRDLARDMISRTGAIIISHPLHVISIRMMAQFVGKETNYNGFYSSIVEIYKQNGLQGYFSGLIPRVLGDIFCVIIASTLTFVANTYIFEESPLQMYTTATMSFLAGTITYPFQVVTNTMAVTKSGLVAGSPPYMPFYTSWLDCWFDLSRNHQLQRGSSILIRYYTGPQVMIGGRPIPISQGEPMSSAY